jgi:hypothetical protein
VLTRPRRIAARMGLAMLVATPLVGIIPHAISTVAVTFFLLAPYIAIDAIHTLIAGDHARTSWLGIGLSISSLIVMPILGMAKKRLGVRLGSGATAGKVPRRSSAPTSPPRCSSGCSPTRSSAAVARPRRRPTHRRPRRQRRPRSLARRGLLLAAADMALTPRPRGRATSSASNVPAGRADIESPEEPDRAGSVAVYRRGALGRRLTMPGDVKCCLGYSHAVVAGDVQVAEGGRPIA